MTGTIPVVMKIPAELLAKAVAASTPIDRHRAMVERLGEACTRTTAAHEIECSVTTINRMVEDGRISTACEGTKIDVRSLADYIERRPEANREARMNKKAGKYYTGLHV